MPPPCERLGNVLGNYLQRGHGTLRNDRRSKLCVTHITGRVAKDLAGLDSYVSASDVDPAALKHTSWLHQRGNGTLRNGHDSKLRATHVEGSVGVDLAGLDSHVSSIDGNPAALKRTTWSRQRGAWLPNKATSAGRCGGPFVRNRCVRSHMKLDCCGWRNH